MGREDLAQPGSAPCTKRSGRKGPAPALGVPASPCPPAMQGELVHVRVVRAGREGLLGPYMLSTNCAKKITSLGVVCVSGRRFMQHAQDGFISASGEMGPEMDFHA